MAESLVAEGSTVALLNKGEIDQQIATAHAYPRSIKKFRDDALAMVTLTESVAAGCIYALPRDGKVIEGPSARCAEVIASAWGNCRAGARVVSDQGEFVTAQGVFHDLERNVAITYEVQRRITNKQNKRFSADMIGVTANAACSIALRNAILKGVPKAFWSDIYEAARKCAAGNAASLATRRADAIKAFAVYGIKEEQILKTLNRAGVADVTLDDLVILRGMYTAIKEGDTTPEEAFAAPDIQIQMPQAKSEKTDAQIAAEGEAADAQAFLNENVPLDQQGAAEEPGLTEGQRKVLLKKMGDIAIDTGVFAELYGTALDDIPLSGFQAALEWLKGKTRA